MIYFLMDTCDWIYCAENKKTHRHISSKLIEFAKTNKIKILVPDILIQEIDRNKERILKIIESSHVSQLRETTRVLEDYYTSSKDFDVQGLVKGLKNASSNNIRNKEIANEKFNAILTFLKDKRYSLPLETKDHHYTSAAKIAIQKKAPFINKNSMGDAILLLHFIDFLNDLPDDKFEKAFFVSSNKTDFSSPTNKNNPHEDIAHHFTKKALFSTNIGEVINSIEANSISPQEITSIETVNWYSCPKGGKHEFDSARGACLRSQYGGVTWQLFCLKCNALYDTGEYCDD